MEDESNMADEGTKPRRADDEQMLEILKRIL